MIEEKTRCLITGVSGLLGNNLSDYFKNQFDILGLYHSNPVHIEGIETERCDLTDPNIIEKTITRFVPEILIHCASLTDIDECEADKERTRRINVIGTEYIVEAICAKDIKLIYISTDAVHDGIKGNFSETDNISPQNYYGLSKYEGESAILRKKNSLIFRTNIFGWNIQDKESLGEWVISSLKANHKIKGFKDAFFSSIYTMEFARIIDLAIKRDLTGVFNCGSINPCSKFEFNTKIASIFGFDQTLVNPISIDESGFRAKRGKNLSLNVSKLQKALNYQLPTIEYCIESFYRDYQCGKPRDLKANQLNYKNPRFISYGRQWISNRDIRAVIGVLRSGRITQGPKVKEFEDALKIFCGAKYAVAVNSATSGLHIACLAAGIDKDDEGITSPITFVASANCVVYCGGRPVFADIDPKTYNISPEEIENKITRKTKVVIPVHFAGQSCHMENIFQVVKDAENRFGNKIWIIEDASHALGSLYKEKKVGSCAFSDMVVMSFHPVKHITTGEGGVVLTNDKAIYERLCRFRSHGITSTPGEFRYNEQAMQPGTSSRQQLVNPWYYEQIELGYNYRITDIQCSLGLSQLKNIDQFNRRRHDIVAIYDGAFNGIDSIQIPSESPDCDSNFHLYVLLFDFDQIGMNRAQFMRELKERGIQTQVHYIPVHTQPYYQLNFQTRWRTFPNAEAYYRKCLSIPLYPAMTEQDIEKVIQEITHLVDIQ